MSMQSTEEGGSRITEINTQHTIFSVLFAENGKQVLGGGAEGMLRRWRVADGNEVGEPIPAEWTEIFASALSPDRKWLVCGLRRPDSSDGKARAAVWNVQTHEKVLDIKGHTNTVFSVDVSPDSTKFATGSADKLAFIWSIATGEQLLGPLEHDGVVVVVRFSPRGDRIATATAENPDDKSIRIYDSDNGQLLFDIPFRVKPRVSSSLAWSVDGSQLFAASYGEVKRFDGSSGSLISQWTVPGGGSRASVALSSNRKFAVVVASKSISFWDTSTQQQIGTTTQRTSDVWSIALSPNDDCIATGEQNGRISLRGLRDVLPTSYLTVNLPFTYIYDGVFKSWMQGDLARAEELLTEEIADPSQHARAFAQRAIVRSRLKQWDLAMEDARKSIEAQRSVMGYIANAVCRIGNGDHESAIRIFDLVFADGLATDNNLLLLIKAVIMFECGEHTDAILRVNDLISIVDDESSYIAVRAHMILLLGCMLLREGHIERAMGLLGRVRDTPLIRMNSCLMLISLIFGWNFDDSELIIQLQLKESVNQLEVRGDDAVQSNSPEEAILHYSAALSLNPSNPTCLLVKRSKAQGMLGLWEKALKDADEAVKVDPASPWGHEGRYTALHALQRYDDAIEASTRMFSLVEGSVDQGIRSLGCKYLSPIQSQKIIDNVVSEVLKLSPFVLVDVRSGHLCDRPKRTHAFKSEQQFKELVSSLTKKSDNEHVQRAVEKYFQYVTLSHVWEGKEPSFQDVGLVGSVWDLDSSPLNKKLREFCEVVRGEGYRWAWSDTCCIDKTISTVLNQSLTMMYKWYEASAATFVHLAGVASPSAIGDLTDSTWMTRTWTAQELLAARVIRFYTLDWKPYLDDTRSNHKESPEIMQELANAIGIARKTIITFRPDDLSVREKLRLASTRKATVEEDMAYSLIGIFESDIRPHYGEGYAALGHLLEETVTRLGEVTVLDWAGKSSPYNSCLPATLAVYSQPPSTSHTIDDTTMDAAVAELCGSLSQTDAAVIYDRFTRLPPVRFANRRLYIPCVIFPVTKISVQDLGHGHEFRYQARASGIGFVEFQTLDKLSLTKPRKFIFVHPWIRDLYDPLDGFTSESSENSDDDNDGSDVGSAPSMRSGTAPSSKVNDHTRALRLLVRLQRPFHALLLQKQSNGEFKRVAAEHEIIVHRIETPTMDLTKVIHTRVLEIL